MSPRPAAVLLAAGAGTRLRPLTDLRAKALCPVGTMTLLEHALWLARPHVEPGPAGVAVNAHHLAEQITAHVGDRMHVRVEQPEALGTAGALAGLREWIDGRDVLVVNADVYIPGGIDALADGWDGARCRLGVVDAAGRADFADSRGPVRYAGVSLLPWRAVRDLRPVPSGLYEVLWRHEDAAGRLDLLRLGGEAVDCGTPRDYLRANLLASGGRSVVGRDAVVEGTVVRSVVWDHAYVGPRERLVECVRAGTRAAPVTVRVTSR